MAENLYISAQLVEDQAVASNQAQPNQIKLTIEAASRLVDRFCEVEEGFFAPFIPDENPEEPVARTFYGSGIDMLRLDPVRTITEVSIDGSALAATEYRIKGREAQYLFRRDGTAWTEDEEISVTAHWGFSQVPADVRLITKELTLYAWRVGDPSFLQQLEIEQTALNRGLSPNAWAMLEKLRDRFSSQHVV